jgi:hypothetical protein
MGPGRNIRGSCLATDLYATIRRPMNQRMYVCVMYACVHIYDLTI